MTKQHVAIAHGNHVIMKNTRVDGVRMLLREHHVAVGQPMHARNRLTGLQRLTRRKAARCRRAREVVPPIDEELDTALAIGAT